MVLMALANKKNPVKKVKICYEHLYIACLQENFEAGVQLNYGGIRAGFCSGQFVLRQLYFFSLLLYRFLHTLLSCLFYLHNYCRFTARCAIGSIAFIFCFFTINFLPLFLFRFHSSLCSLSFVCCSLLCI